MAEISPSGGSHTKMRFYQKLNSGLVYGDQEEGMQNLLHEIEQMLIFLKAYLQVGTNKCQTDHSCIVKPLIWKTRSTSSICIGCSNNNTVANSRLSAWGLIILLITPCSLIY